MRSKKQIIIIFLCDDDEERSPFPSFPVVVSKEKYFARLLISQKEAHATTVLDAQSEEKERERRERFFDCSSHTTEIFPRGKKN